MVSMKDVEQYLNCRDGRWYYLRRVPAEVAELDGRKRIRTALETSSLDLKYLRLHDAFANKTIRKGLHLLHFLG